MPDRRFAENTSVPIERSQADLVALIKRNVATGYQWAEQNEQVGLQFIMNDRRVRFVLTLPSEADRRFRTTPTGRARSADASAQEHAREYRRMFRSLLLVVKVKFEAVSSGITTFEEEFLAHIVLPEGDTIGQRTIPAIGATYQVRELPPLLPAPGSR